jgi:hypothetical protein
MSWKVKRASPPTRTLNVPVGVAWDAEGQRPVIPHRTLIMPDGRKLEYAGPLHMPEYVDGASYHTQNGLRVSATISEAYPELGPLLQAALLYLRKDPSWREITAIKELFFGPDLDAMMMLPKEQHFVHGWEGDEDSHIFHVWQLPPAWEAQLWPQR